MKILIVAQTSSGSTSLLKAMSKGSGLPMFFEPFGRNRADINKDSIIIKNTNNLVVKVVDNQFNQINEFTDSQKFFSLFDKVVGLTRESTHENVTSYLIASYFQSWPTSKKDIKITKEEYDKIISIGYEEQFKHSDKIKKDIKSFDIFQTTYEGLYINKTQWRDLEKYLGFEVEKYIEP